MCRGDTASGHAVSHWTDDLDDVLKKMVLPHVQGDIGSSQRCKVSQMLIPDASAY
jgi:hypothetical protein